MKRLTNFATFIGLISSLITVFNVLLALPSIFKDLDASYLVKITEKNFALKLGFILILQFAIGYLLSFSIASASKTRKMQSFFSVGLFSILITCWLTFFNVSEILYSIKLQTINQHLGMLFFILLAFLMQGFQILTWEWGYSFYDSWSSSSAEEYKKIQSEKDYLGGKFFIIGILFFFQIILFAVYWLN
jgi:hypothetical protein